MALFLHKKAVFFFKCWSSGLDMRCERTFHFFELDRVRVAGTHPKKFRTADNKGKNLNLRDSFFPMTLARKMTHWRAI
jgi:hypothetical protein